MNDHLSLLTDLYQLTMGEAYFQSDKHTDTAVFHLFYRKAPFKGQACIAAGLEQVIEFLKTFKFHSSDIAYLKTLKGQKNISLFSNEYLEYLSQMTFSCDIHAVSEGTMVYPNTPILRVEGPLIQCQIIETILLNIINFQTLIATKASRVYQAAEGTKVFEFGLRRAQGTNGALHASRASYIGGVNATSNTLAGQMYDIPVVGTHAHSWIMSFDNELDAFMNYAKIMPHNCTLLVDTYDTIQGTKNAVIVANYLLSIGHELSGIRLDSGDLLKLSQECRKILDDAGLYNALIVASNDLDEYEIKRLRSLGSKIDIWGVGTKLVTAYDQPALGGVFKLAALKCKGQDTFQYKMKLSNDAIKNSLPGILQVRRYKKKNTVYKDVIYNMESFENFTSQELKEISNGDLEITDQLIPIFKSGKLVYDIPRLEQVRMKTLSELEIFNNSSKFIVSIDSKLERLQESLMNY